MIRINKDKTYLQQFEDQSKIQYDFVSKAKWIGWLLVSIISIAIHILPQFPVFIVIGVVAGIMSATSGIDAMSLSSNSIVMVVGMFLTTGLGIVGFFFYVKAVERRPFYTIGLRQAKRLRKYMVGGLIAIGMQLTYFLIVHGVGFAHIIDQPVSATSGTGFDGLGIVFLALIAFLVQGAGEEVMVRGWLFPVLAKHYKALTAIIISSALFMALHLGNNAVSAIPLINLFLYGVFALMYALNEGGLWGIFAFHSIWNWFMGNVLGLPVSGIIFGNASIIETKLTGPTYITGGAFGPEGGLIVSVLLIAGIIVLTKKCLDKNIIEVVGKDTRDESSIKDSVFDKSLDDFSDLDIQKSIKDTLDHQLIEKSNGEIEMSFE